MAERTTRKQRRGIAALANLSPKQHGSFAQIQPQKATTAAQPLAKLSDKVKPRLADSWIADAYTYADEIGEVGFVVNLQANLGSRCLWVPQEFDVQTGDWIDSENEAVLKAMSAFQGPHGGQMELRRRAFLHMAIAGESLLLASPTDEPDVATGVVWEFLSSQEIKVGFNDKAIRYRDGRGMPGEPIDPAETYLARCWRSHPQFCADDQTEILTIDGWRRHDELGVGDVVLTLNHETGLSEWQPVEAVNRFDVVDTPMLSMESQNHSSLTTMAHRWPTIKLRLGDRHWTTSAGLRQTDLLITAAAAGDLPSEPKYSDAFVELVAWYWTEGAEREPVIGQSSAANPEHCESIRACLTQLFGPAYGRDMRHGQRGGFCTFPECDWPIQARGLCHAHDEQRRAGRELKSVRRQKPRPADKPPIPPRWREYHDPRKPVISFRLNEAAAAELLAVAPKRQVDLGFIRSLTRSQLELFIRKSIDADGHIQPQSGMMTITQKRRAMLEPFEMACVLAGYAPRIRQDKSYYTSRVTGEKVSPCWTVTIGRSSLANVTNRLRSVRTYTGVVWCPTTAHGTWYARRSGKGYFTGNSSLSDSPLRRCLTIANEILYLTRSIAAAVRSRLAAGVFLVPEDADFTASNQEDEDLVDAETDAVDGMERAQLRSVDELGLIIAKHLRAPIEDPLAPGSIIPLILQVKKESIDFFKLIDLAKAIDPQTQDLLAKALERLPRALDIDPGILDGKSTSNHWNGWLIDDDLVQKHVIPAGELIVEFVTVAYLRPALETFFGMTPEQSRLFKLVLDPSPIQARSDAAVSARVLFEEGVLKVETLLRANGFDPSDAPDDQEWIRQFARKMLLRSPALGPVLGVTAGLPDLDWSAAIPATGAGGPLASSPVSVAGAPTKKIAPTSETSGLGRPTGASVEAQSFTTLMTQVATAADAAIFRAFELAGARFASHAKKDAGLRTRIAGIDRGQVLTAVAPSDLVQLGVTHEVLFDGAWKALNQNVRCWVRDYEQNARGVESLIADDLGAVAAGNLCDALTLFVLDHRHSPIGRQRNGLAIPDELVLEALHGAGVM